MSRGDVIKGSSSTYYDRETGARVRQVTDFPCINHHPFYYLRAFDDPMSILAFASLRTGRPEIYAEWQDDGRIMQLTERNGINDYSFQASPDGRYVYYTTADAAYMTEVSSCREEEVARFADFAGSATAAGTTTVSHDGLWWAVPVKLGAGSGMVIISTATGKAEIILEKDSIGHPEFHPDDSSLLRYAGHYTNRIWVVNRDGSEDRLAYERNAEEKEWIVHETWRPGSREILTTQWPHGIIGIDIDSGAVRKVCSFNAWHPSVNRQGTMMCADTTFPDRGLQLFDVLDGKGEPRTLCLSDSSNEGAHWDTDHCPYDDGPTKVYAPQHTHPHPAFSPDGRCVAYTSDRTGWPQVYVVEIPDANIKERTE